MYRKTLDPADTSFKLANSPFYLMAHADYRYHEDMDKVLAKHGVNKSIYRILTVLRECEVASVSHLAETAMMKRATVSRIVDRMVERGLVTSGHNPDDNRITDVRLTAAGHDKLATLTPIVGRQFARAAQGISDAELKSLVSVLRRIGDNLGKLAIE